jgi:hypothetical protein
MRNSKDLLSMTKAFTFALLYAAAGAALSAQAMMKAAPQAQPSAQPSAQANAQVSVSGAIASISGGTLFVTSSGGTATSVAIGKDTLILGRKSDTLDSIKPGEAMGVTSAMAADGSQTATAINVFPPELWQRVRKGQWKMDNGLYMTNAQVDRSSAGVQGRVLYMKYEMLTAAITVPNSAEIRRSVILSLADLKPGMNVMVRGVAGADGLLAASFVSFDLKAN